MSHVSRTIYEVVEKKRSPDRLKQYLLHRELLISNGYKESQKKPNLFYKKQLEDIIFFADMRETRFPRFFYKILNKKCLVEPDGCYSYIQTNEDGSYYFFDIDWRLTRRIYEEGVRLKKLGMEFTDDCFSLDITDEDYELRYTGYCLHCKKDLRDNREYCDSDCETQSDLQHGIKHHCKACKNIFNESEMIRHHLNYEKDEIVLVCKSCHTRLHKTDLHPELKPTDKRPVSTTKGIRKQKAKEKAALNRTTVRHLLQLKYNSRKKR